MCSFFNKNVFGLKKKKSNKNCISCTFIELILILLKVAILNDILLKKYICFKSTNSYLYGALIV